jgi:hypothetical protein
MRHVIVRIADQFLRFHQYAIKLLRLLSRRRPTLSIYLGSAAVTITVHNVTLYEQENSANPAKQGDPRIPQNEPQNVGIMEIIFE